ncbi:PA domain protein [Burkholderia thailandensis]|uniref:PA domain-containing protein n=1 Tax=Burkholderia thailandensis TaxID=57975 RepID=UPI00148EA8C0|nr:PA domain-containing protein [Burkholderia thailandensis]NOK47903.1 PA domain protein [Burkholderia thailandensis]
MASLKSWTRRLLGASGCALSLALSTLGAAHADSAPDAPPSAWPSAALPDRAAVDVDASQLLPTPQLVRWQIDLDRRGLRSTGSPAHERYIDVLHRRLARAGVPQIYTEAAALTRWTARHWRLDVADGAPRERIDVTGYLPYSGDTGRDGIVAPIRYLAAGQMPDADVAGKIAVVEWPSLPLSGAFFREHALRVFDPDNAFPPSAPYVRTSFMLGSLTAMLDSLQAAGAAGVVMVADTASAEATDLYAPYDGRLRRVPGLFVDRATGARLALLAQRGATLRLSLDSSVEHVRTRNLIGIIPGMSDELTIVNSHTDGTNGIEDNGPNAIVAIAQYLSRLPRAALPRTVMILLSSGHFAGGVGAEDFLARHARDGLVARIACIVTIEHLGAQEWLPNARGALAPTGRAEPTALFMPAVPALVDAADALVRRANAAPAFVMPPLNPNGDGSADDAVWPGEGQYFWGLAHVPTINLITGPTYLLDYGVTTADKIDYARLRREIAATTQALLDLSRVPFAALRAVQLAMRAAAP